MLIFDDINQGINKQDLGTEKVWSFFPAFSDKKMKAVLCAAFIFYPIIPIHKSVATLL